MKFFFDDGGQHISRYGASNLRLHRVLTSSQKSLYTQVLLDPLEEQLNLPTAFVKLSNGQGRQSLVVGQKHRRLARCRAFEFHPAQMFRVVSSDVKAVQFDALIADDTAGSACCTRVHMSGVHAALGAGNKKSTALVKFEQPSKIQIAPVHDVEGVRFERQDVEHVHIAEFAVADLDEHGDCLSQIQQRVHLHCSLSRAKWRPVEHTQTQVDFGGVQRVEGARPQQCVGLRR